MSETAMGIDQPETAEVARNRVLEILVIVSLFLSALLFALRPLWISLPASDLDGSWMVVLGEAATRPARWGVDIAFTYGPASALVTRYFTDHYLTIVLPFAMAVAMVYGVIFSRLVYIATAGSRSRLFRRWHVPSATLAEMAGLLVLTPQIPDPFYFVLAFNIFLLDVCRMAGDRISRRATVAGAVLMGGIALSKSSYGALALVLFVLADARTVVLSRRIPALSIAFVLAFLLSFILLGQHLGDLPAYVKLQGQVTAGYSEAMYIVGSRIEFDGFIAAGGALLLAAILSCRYGGRRIDRCFGVVGLAIVLVLVFKAGFLRQDTHPQIAWATLGLLGLSTAVTMLPHARRAAGALTMTSLIVLWIVMPLFYAQESDASGGLQALSASVRAVSDGVSAELGSWQNLLRDPAAFVAAQRAGKAEAFTAIRANTPLPPLRGTVDILPSAQTFVLASGLDYHPRPSFQDYSTYTVGLIEANLDFYRGADGPEWVLFGPGGLDDRFPTMTEGALWPDLWRRYEPVQRSGDLLVLHRREAPLPDVLGPPQRSTVRLGDRFDVPPGPVFAHVTVRKTMLGQLAAVLFRPPGLRLAVTLANGIHEDYRFIPALGEGGFLLSPLVSDSNGFALLAVGDGAVLGSQTATEASVTGSRMARLFYEPDIAVEVQPVALQSNVPSPEARPFFDALALRRPWRRLAARLARPGSFDGDRLAASAPTEISVPAGEASRLKLGFAIDDGAWTKGDVNGVCFSARATHDATVDLWRRCLDPRNVAADRGPQVAEVSLPPGLPTVTLQTNCMATCDWGWAYWSDILPLK